MNERLKGVLRPHLIAGLLMLVAGCSRPAPTPPLPPGPPPNAVAQVGDEAITEEQLKEAMARRRVPDDLEAKRALLNEMIRYRALVQEGRRRGYDRNPDVVAALESMLADKVRQADATEVQQRAKISPEEIETFYRAQIPEFTLPARVRVAMIFVEAPKTLSNTARSERLTAIEAAREKALALGNQTPGFGALAAEYSYDQATKFRGGDIGYFVEGTSDSSLDHEVLAAAFALKEPGDVSGPIATDRGFYLVRLMERQPGGVRPLAQVEKQIRQRLAREKLTQLTQEAAQAHVPKQSVVIFENRLATVRPNPAPTTTRGSAGDPPPLPAN